MTMAMTLAKIVKIHFSPNSKYLDKEKEREREREILLAVSEKEQMHR